MTRCTSSGAALALAIGCILLTLCEGQSPSASPQQCACRINRRCAGAAECAQAGTLVGGIIGGVVGGLAIVLVVTFMYVRAARKRCCVLTIKNGKGRYAFTRVAYCMTPDGCCVTPASRGDPCLADHDAHGRGFDSGPVPRPMEPAVPPAIPFAQPVAYQVPPTAVPVEAYPPPGSVPASTPSFYNMQPSYGTSYAQNTLPPPYAAAPTVGYPVAPVPAPAPYSPYSYPPLPPGENPNLKAGLGGYAL